MIPEVQLIEKVIHEIWNMKDVFEERWKDNKKNINIRGDSKLYSSGQNYRDLQDIIHLLEGIEGF